MRVRATNSDGYTQDAFDYYVTDDGKQYGMGFDAALTYGYIMGETLKKEI